MVYLTPLDLLLPLTIYAPGYFVVRKLTKKSLSNLETIVIGFAVWEYVIVTGGYVIAIVSNFTVAFLELITYAGAAVMVLGLIDFARTTSMHHLGGLERKLIRVLTKPSYLLGLCLAVVLSLFISVLILAHSIYYEFDAIFIYLPLAKSIVLTGGLHFDVLRLNGIVAADSPALPLLYAWFVVFYPANTTFDLMVRTLPLFTLFMTALLTYLITKRLTSSTETGFIGLIGFLSTPVVLAVASNYSLYLDISFAFFLLLVTYMLMCLPDHKSNSFWLFGLGAAATLMLLTKDLGFLVIPGFIALVLSVALPRAGRFWRGLELAVVALIFGASYDAFFVIDVMQAKVSLQTLVIIQVPVLIGSVAFAIAIAYFSKRSTFGIDGMSLVQLALVASPAILYIARNLLVFQALSYTLPLSALAKQAENVLSFSAGPLPTNLVTLLRWDTLFWALGLGAVFVIPLAIGITFILGRFHATRDWPHLTVITVLLALLTTWSWTFYLGYAGSLQRVLLYFAPLIGVFVAVGVDAYSKGIGSRSSTLLRFLLFDTLAMAYLWLDVFGFSNLSILGITIELSGLGGATLAEMAVFTAIFFIAFFPWETIRDHLKGGAGV